MELKKIFPFYNKFKEALNVYIQKNLNDESRLTSSMDISVDGTLARINNNLKRQNQTAVYDYSLKPTLMLGNDPVWKSLGVNVDNNSLELLYRGKSQNLMISPNESGEFSTYSIISLNGTEITKDFLSKKTLGFVSSSDLLFGSDRKSSSEKRIFADNSSSNTQLIKDAFLNARSSTLTLTFDSSPTSYLDSDVILKNFLKEPNEPSIVIDSPVVQGPYSMLPEYEDNLKKSDREFMNSVLSLAVYSSNDKWVDSLNEKLSAGEQLDVNQILKDNNIFSESSDLDRAVAAFYGTTFSPANIMKNGSFEGEMGKGEVGDFEFKNGVYRSNDNICSASAMLSKNDDGTFTLHMAYRGTDNDSRTSGKLSSFEKKNPAIKAFNSIVRFGRYALTAYSDMGRHHDNFTPFDRACLEFASNPENKIKNIEVSGHSLGGAMVQRFLKSDILLNSEFKDKVQGMTWGAPQTNANVLGKTLVVSKRIIEDSIMALKDVTVKSYVEYLTTTNMDIKELEKDKFKSAVSKTLFPPLIIANVAIGSVVNLVPNVAKFTKNVAGIALNYGKKAADMALSIKDDFSSDVNQNLRDYKNIRNIQRDLNGRGMEANNKINAIWDALHIIPDNIAAVLSAIPNSIGPMTKRLSNYWKDVGPVSLPESQLRQYAHDKDPIPLVTKLFASNVGNKHQLSNYVDKMPLWQQLVKNWDKPIDSENILSGEFKHKEKKYGLVGAVYKSSKILASNFLGHLSTDKHNMRKYVINTMMKDSFFRRTNIHSDNSRFDSVSVNDQNWLNNTPNISKFEGLLHGMRLENLVLEDARAGTQFKDHREVKVRDFAVSDINDGQNSVSSHMNRTLYKLNNLYGKTISCVSENYAKSPDFSNCANESFIVFNHQRTVGEKLQDLSDSYVANRRSEALSRNLAKELEASKVYISSNMVSHAERFNSPLIINTSKVDISDLSAAVRANNSQEATTSIVIDSEAISRNRLLVKDDLLVRKKTV